MKRILVQIVMFCILTASLTAAAKVLKATNAAEAGKLANTLKPGDTLILKNGVWKDQTMDIWAKGSKEQPITIRAETPGGVIFTGKSLFVVGGKHLIVSGLLFKDGSAEVPFRRLITIYGSHIRLTNTAVTNSAASQWVYVKQKSEHVEIDHCDFGNKKSKGQLMTIRHNSTKTTKPNFHHIHHNYFHDFKRGNENSFETLQIGQGPASKIPSKTVVEYNLFERCSGEDEIISNKSYNNTYRYNVFRHCLGGLTLRAGKNCLVEGNYFFGGGIRGTGGVRLCDDNHRVINNYFANLNERGAIAMTATWKIEGPKPFWPRVTNALVAFNTIVNCKDAFWMGWYTPKNTGSIVPKDIIISNNLIVGKGRFVFYSEQTIPENMSCEGNIVDGREMGHIKTQGFKKIVVKMIEKDGVQRPAPGSPVIGTAEGKLPKISTDIDGQDRGTKKDVGCDQLSEKPVKRKPVSKADVGISWKL
ncbi:MAG: right-handed parallel beta-helix repeat-containing protein [Lentisphaeria bacterium]|nr:polysaccharide lyase 6 family protein [Lentisphaeria bacterium]NQZ67344.1 right-handed parallel beta-helix repeat-containing protein [Lentisphaeria bacterium]